MTKENFLRDPFRVLERRIRGIKYAVIGESEYGLTELSADSEIEARTIAALWRSVYIGKAECFCVQNGEIGGRPFFSVL